MHWTFFLSISGEKKTETNIIIIIKSQNILKIIPFEENDSIKLYIYKGNSMGNPVKIYMTCTMWNKSFFEEKYNNITLLMYMLLTFTSLKTFS